MQPASTNESQTAAPATSPAAPSSEKMPAPTIAPTPMKAACRMFMYALVWLLMMTPLLFPRTSMMDLTEDYHIIGFIFR